MAAKPEKPVSTEPRNARAAAAEARRGCVDRAVEALTRFADAGDAAAAASLAEILAYRGDWAAVSTRAAALIAQPTAVYAGNVFTDMTRLLRRAARELGDDSLITNAAKTVSEKLKPMAKATLLNEVSLPSESLVPATAAARAAFAKTIAEAASERRFARAPAGFAQYGFNLAVSMRIPDEIHARWRALEGELRFDAAVVVARWLAREGKSDEAWKTLESKLATWWPVDKAQVAPVELLVDKTLAPLMTPDQCAKVLATPRGPEATASPAARGSSRR